MPSRDPEARRETARRYYSTKGRQRRAQRYREQRGEPELTINPRPLARAIENWRTQ